MPWVKVSAAMARLRFNGCDPDYIRTTCHAHCCESSVDPSGTMIEIHPSERAAVEAHGGVVDGTRLRPVARRCPFKTGVDLCALHGQPAKPFGCVASPFKLNGKDTLIVRNRYKLLRCYDDGRRLPAYVAFRGSLERLFGARETARIVAHLEAGGGDLLAWMADAVYSMLRADTRSGAREAAGELVLTPGPTQRRQA